MSPNFVTFLVVLFQAVTLDLYFFISFINELAEILGELYVTAQFFADDLKIYAEVLTNIDIDSLQL